MSIAPEPSPSLDQPGPVGEGIEIALSNLFRMTRMIPSSLAAVQPKHRTGLIAVTTDSIDAEIRAASVFLERFETELVGLGKPGAAFAERALAHTILIELGQWMTTTRMQRSLTNAPKPTTEWVVPQAVLDRMLKLDELGRALRGTWIVASSAHAATASAGTTSGSPRSSMSRVYLMYRDWTKFPAWFEFAKVDSADDDALLQRMDDYLRNRLPQLEKQERDEFINAGILTQIEGLLASGARRHSLMWRAFGWAESEEAGAAVITLVDERVGLALTYSRLPKAGLPIERWAMLEREVGELDEQIRDREVGKSANIWGDAPPLPIRLRLRKEAVEFGPIVAEAPQPLAHEPEPKEEKKAGAPPTNGITHAPDFSWLVTRGKSYQFKAGQQRKVIAALFALWETSGGRDGHGMGEAALAVELECNISRLRIRRLFQGNPALDEVLTDVDKGTWALCLLSPPPPKSKPKE